MDVNQQLSVYTFIWKMNILSILKGKQYIDAVMSKKTVKESMFTTWMEANKIYPHDRKLTYPQYVSSFVYVARNRCWKPRKQGYTIGRLIWVPPSTGELFFVRMILFVAKGPTSYDEIRKIDGVRYPTFRAACFALDFLEMMKNSLVQLEKQKIGALPMSFENSLYTCL
ncbi:hypothetical protein JHK87_042879 [Glycine soja]|nr:hypothetical protein JHK87_042879 [Glycine soja]